MCTVPTKRFGRRCALKLGALVALASLEACSSGSSASPTGTAGASPTSGPAVSPTTASAGVATTMAPSAAATSGTGSAVASGRPAMTAAASSVTTGTRPATIANAAGGNRPNIILINTDDLDTKSLPVMPKLKALMTDQGTTFPNYFVNVSLCCPSRSALLRGQYAHNNEVLTNQNPNGGYAHVHALGIENSTIATWLQAAGYRTALMGKYLNGYPASVADTFVPPGWTEWYSPVAGNAYSEYNYKLNENGKVVAYTKKPEDYLTDVIANKATDFIKRSASDPAPFFLYLPTYAPHGPATPGPKYENAFPDAKAPRSPAYNEQDVADKPQWVQNMPPLAAKQQTMIDELYRKRIQSLQSVDDLIENVINTLKDVGKLDNTYVIFTSDNGFHLGEHREPSGKQAPYEEDIRLPLIVRGPGVAAGKSIEPFVGNVDFAPTFAQWAGATVPDFVDGRSFAPLLSGGAADAWRQTFLIAHYTAESRRGKRPAATGVPPRRQATPGGSAAASTTASGVPETDEEVEAAVGRGIPEFHGLRAKDYVYIEYATKERELYDLAKDPYELQNIAKTANPALLTQLSARLGDLQKASGATFRTAEAQPMPPLVS